MISARRLVESSGNFWRDIAPLLPNYVKHVNMGGYDRYDPPLRSGSEKGRHFLINELAFSCHAESISVDSDHAEELYGTLQIKWSARLPSNIWIDVPISPEERDDLRALTARLTAYGRSLRLAGATYEQVLPAVGRLESVEIDILTDNAIAEVKAGERPFRSIDFRQLIVALIALGPVRKNNQMMLINPREGVVWRERAEDFIEAVSLRSFSEFFGDVVFELSEVGVST